MSLNSPFPDSDVLRDVWDADGAAEFDADCSPTKVCRNAREFSFDGIADGNGDPQASWRQLLEREGKLSNEGISVRDLVLGAPGD